MLESWWQRQKPLPVETSLELWPEVWCFIKAVAKGLCIDMACLPEVPLWLVPEVLPFHARAAVAHLHTKVVSLSSSGQYPQNSLPWCSSSSSWFL